LPFVSAPLNDRKSVSLELSLLFRLRSTPSLIQKILASFSFIRPNAPSITSFI
jgi:hypothetical protein